MVSICPKKISDCNACRHYRYDENRNDKACFISKDSQPTLSNYKAAIAAGDLDLANQIYNQVFKKQTS